MSKVKYVPVKAGFEIECEGETSWKLYTSEGDIGVVDSMDREKEHYLYAEPHGLYLCQATLDEGIPDEVADAIAQLEAFVTVHLFMYHGGNTPADDEYKKAIDIVRPWLDQQQKGHGDDK